MTWLFIIILISCKMFFLDYNISISYYMQLLIEITHNLKKMQNVKCLF